MNNSQVARITSSGLSVGTGSPTEALDVTGNVRFSGALMPNNFVGQQRPTAAKRRRGRSAYVADADLPDG